MTLSLLGSTGSIGRQTLEVMEPLGMRPVVLAAGRNAALLEEQARRFLPELACVADEDAGRSLKAALADTSVTVRYGAESILEAAAYLGADTVLNALPGVGGLRPTLAALRAGKRLLLANKESLVCGGKLVTNATERGIIPVDSEHSAIFQCIERNAPDTAPARILLTASGGAFRGFTREQLSAVTPDMALAHPTWTMGAKVTVDSAALLNKGLEVIEAMHLFGLPAEKIDVILHPESIIHSMVEYTDGAVLAQLAPPDMRLPIQYALTYPKRRPCPAAKLDFTALGALTFAPPDRQVFRCLALAERAARAGGNMGAVLCGAGENAVEAFLRGECGFLDIPERIERALDSAPYIENPTVDDILQTVENCRW
ncbi:MAG: 1-deoxy-D-xylulose-5-phosphate reductoisomerase [Oscillospiraceae bacterium]|jgi:1-deoxy-D-xylulose-5-phosphate reductoisomerase|nr:1-deoxy-D-xylulose-5-phosphate reductoisomerase [Oscillospiraceae bacterium]